MTDDQRLDKFDEKLHDLDKRQVSFEARVDMYIERMDQALAIQRERMNRLEDKHDADIKELRADNKETRRMLYTSIGAQIIGVIAILIAVYLK